MMINPFIVELWDIFCAPVIRPAAGKIILKPMEKPNHYHVSVLFESDENYQIIFDIGYYWPIRGNWYLDGNFLVKARFPEKDLIYDFLTGCVFKKRRNEWKLSGYDRQFKEFIEWPVVPRRLQYRNY